MENQSNSQLQLAIVTPNKMVLETSAASVTIPGSEGEMGILPGHVPLITTLDSGVLLFQNEGKSKPRAIAIHWGYAQVDNDNVTVLAELAETAEEIDVLRAEVAKKKATEALNQTHPPADDWDDEQHRINQYEADLSRAVSRQHAATFK